MQSQSETQKPPHSRLWRSFGIAVVVLAGGLFSALAFAQLKTTQIAHPHIATDLPQLAQAGVTPNHRPFAHGPQASHVETRHRRYEAVDENGVGQTHVDPYQVVVLGRTRQDIPVARPPQNPKLSKTNAAISATITELRAAEDESSRQAKAEELRELLDKAFELDYQQRDESLKKLEARATRLRKQLERRKESRAEIIDVRVKSLLYEAEGIGGPIELGFGRPTAWQPVTKVQGRDVMMQQRPPANAVRRTVPARSQDFSSERRPATPRYSDPAGADDSSLFGDEPADLEPVGDDGDPGISGFGESDGDDDLFDDPSGDTFGEEGVDGEDAFGDLESAVDDIFN